MKISDEIVKQQFVQREYGLAHSTYDNELDFYQLVSSGDVKAVSGMLQTGEEDEAVLAARGILSDDKIRNQRYHEIVLVAMISRFCIEEGMEEMESYNLSDFYINKLDKAQTKQQIINVHNQLIMDYARRMKRVKKKAAISPHCVRAMDYVYDHLHERIEITGIAEFVGVERSYLSKLFHKEVGRQFLITSWRRNSRPQEICCFTRTFPAQRYPSILHLRPTVTLQNASETGLAVLRVHIAGQITENTGKRQNHRLAMGSCN